MMYIKTEDDSYVKDGSSGAVLNTNSTAYAAFKQQRQSLKNAQKLQEDVESLKDEINEIKTLLKMFIERAQ